VGTAETTTLVTLGRLSLPTIQDDFKEGFGAPLDTTGAGAALGQRKPKAYTFTLPILPFNGLANVDLLAVAERMRRQLRSMGQNAQLRGQGIFFAFEADPELDGWVMIGQGQIAYADGNIVVGNFTVTIDEIYRVASLWTHRPGLRIINTDRRLASTPRDFLEQLFSTDFAALPAISIVALPPGAADVATASGAYPSRAIWTGADGSGYTTFNVPDGETFSFELPEASRNLGQVVAYDRRGHITSPSPGPDTLWEEVYGGDWPYSWLTAGQPHDTPLLQNGCCRVRYDESVGLPGWKVDTWSGTAWIEQGKMCVIRQGSAVSPDDTWISAGIVEWSPERCVVKAVLVASSDILASREQVYITLQRGWEGPRFEVYPAVEISGTRSGVKLAWYDALAPETSLSVTRIAAGGAVTSAPVNSATLPAGSLGAFDGENHWTMLRAGATVAVVGAVVQAVAYPYVFADTLGYGVTRNGVATVADSPAGYVSVQLAFPLRAADQAIEAEAIRNASGTTSQVADATASGGQCVKETQTAETNFTLTAAVPTLIHSAKYRALVRVKADSGATLTVKSYSEVGVSTRVGTSTSTTWAEVDLGDITFSSATPSLDVDLWRSAGSGSVYIDRVDLILLEQPVYADGARQIGQRVLTDSRGIPTQVER
jgi:hypothetical protein